MHACVKHRWCGHPKQNTSEQFCCISNPFKHILQCVCVCVCVCQCDFILFFFLRLCAYVCDCKSLKLPVPTIQTHKRTHSNSSYLFFPLVHTPQHSSAAAVLTGACTARQVTSFASSVLSWAAVRAETLASARAFACQLSMSFTLWGRYELSSCYFNNNFLLTPSFQWLNFLIIFLNCADWRKPRKVVFVLRSQP